MMRVLVIGGYGGFGARLSRRLAGDGWQVLVAGRSADKARAFAAGLPEAEGVAFDRNGDCAVQLASLQADLVIDAAGPFQGSSYALPRACIAAGLHYLDLADARGFVCGIGPRCRARWCESSARAWNGSKRSTWQSAQPPGPAPVPPWSAPR
jgi:saccharopine dehydrogenase-like NADP-dependent oxidoreductase